jgi:hypothetical protein
MIPGECGRICAVSAAKAGRFRPNRVEKRTSASKAGSRIWLYGTAEAVPFVETFPQPLRPQSFVFSEGHGLARRGEQ